MHLLEAQGLTKYFGGLAAVKNVDFHVDQNEIVGLIGPNGAGKTTLFNCITGFYKPTSGVVKFKGKKITGLKSHQICHEGINRTYQIVKLFPSMTALKTVTVALFFGKKKLDMSMEDARQRAMELLEYVMLSGKENELAKNLTIVNQKRLELARALATGPEILLLDEVVAGLNPKEVVVTMELIKNLRDKGITVFMVEHVMKAVMGISDRIMVLHHGEKIAEGNPKEIANDDVVIRAYLGERYVL